MPVYPYKCEACGHEFDEIQKVKDGPLKKCPECKKNKLRRVITAPILTYVSEPQTVGTLAEKNAKFMSQEQKNKLAAEYKTKKIIHRIPDKQMPGKRMDIPEKTTDKNRTKTNKEVGKLKGKQIHKYIMTGE